MSAKIQLRNYQALRRAYEAKALIPTDHEGMIRLRASYRAMDLTEAYYHFRALKVESEPKDMTRKEVLGQIMQVYLENNVRTRRMAIANTHAAKMWEEEHRKNTLPAKLRRLLADVLMGAFGSSPKNNKLTAPIYR